jgi:hypothetical protein
MQVTGRRKCEDAEARIWGKLTSAMKERRIADVGISGSGQAMANLGATVRSLSSFALFLSNACCRQSSRLLQL